MSDGRISGLQRFQRETLGFYGNLIKWRSLSGRVVTRRCQESSFVGVLKGKKCQILNKSGCTYSVQPALIFAYKW